jgi:hypothetical protein
MQARWISGSCSWEGHFLRCVLDEPDGAIRGITKRAIQNTQTGEKHGVVDILSGECGSVPSR